MALDQSQARRLTPLLVKIGLGLVALSIVGYILGPPLYWHFVEGVPAYAHSSSSPSCAPCDCDCSSQPLISIPEAIDEIEAKKLTSQYHEEADKCTSGMENERSTGEG